MNKKIAWVIAEQTRIVKLHGLDTDNSSLGNYELGHDRIEHHYWLHGYLTALKSVMKMLEKGEN